MPGIDRRRISDDEGVSGDSQSSSHRPGTGQGDYQAIQDTSARLLEHRIANEEEIQQTVPSADQPSTRGFGEEIQSLSPVLFETNQPGDQTNQLFSQPGVFAQASIHNGVYTVNGLEGQVVLLVNGTSDSPYEMKVLVQPLPQVRPGTILNPPIVVSLDKTAGREYADQDSHRLWGFVSVTTEDGMTSLAPPRNDLLAGNPTDSVHSLAAGPDGRETRFMSFTNIAICATGRYRLRISLVRMDLEGAAQGQSMVNVQSTLSRVIHVSDEAGPPSPGKCIWGIVLDAILTTSRSRGSCPS